MDNNKKSGNFFINTAVGIKTFFFRFFTCFSLLILILSLAGLMMNVHFALLCSQMLWIALFSALVSVSFAITDVLSHKKCNLVIVRTTHFVLCFISFVLTFVLGGAADTYLTNTSAATNRVLMIICMSLLFIGVYAVVGFIRIGVQILRKKSANKHQDYENLYTDSEH